MSNLIAAGLAAALLSSGVAAAPALAPAVDSGSARCSTAKGVLRATDTWSPNVKKTLHQVYLVKSAKVQGNSHLPYTYDLFSVKNNAGAPVSYGTNAWIFQVPRNERVSVTVTWRAKVPMSLNQFLYASCTMSAG